ncbi:Acb2/Tad1 domain-containing protein [Agrobacterium sp. CG674]
MNHPYSSLVCKGSVMLGNGCKRCERCTNETDAIRAISCDPTRDPAKIIRAGELTQKMKELQAAKAEKADTHQVPINTTVDSLSVVDANIGEQVTAAMSEAVTTRRITAGSPSGKYHTGGYVNAPSFAAGGVAGLPVKGYKATQEPWKIAMVNENKILEELVLRQIEIHTATGGIDQRFVALARTKIQEAFMELNRAVFQPERLASLDGAEALMSKLGASR